jgi:class 3 adenylate cyclase/tetratricopeptide (TPR) repeat protein
MKCPRCQHENHPTAKFCQECAAPLALACRNCGSPLPAKARFCPECAHPAEERAAGSDAPALEGDLVAAAGERRQATVVFADISGYTQLCTSVDAEQVQALLNRFYALMDGTVAAYGGKVIDHAGDGVLAVFGAPVAFGNDPERAVRAALEMQASAAQLSEPSGRPLKLHIGIASGEVVAAVLSGGATPKYAVTGDTVNLAARLDALAQAGDTVLSQSVYDSVSSLVDADDLGEKAVKGFAAQIRVYRVLALRHGVGERLPFVGRHGELRQLTSVLETVRETGAGSVVVIRGDPGIGKSRLIEELRWRALAQGFACHVGRVLDFGVGKGQEALPAVVATLLGLRGHESEPVRRAALGSGIDSGLIAPEHEPFITDLLDVQQRPELETLFDAMDNTTRLRRTAEAVAAVAATAARKQPQLIAFEDIHWTSPLLLGCLAALAMATRERSLVLAMTTRFEGDPLDRNWRAASHGTPLLAIDVGPLLPDEARVLAGGVIDTSNRFARECVERAEGNPLFLEQLLRNARESDGGAIPPTIQSLVLARMDRLPTRDKLALQAASVIGKRFTLDGLRFLLEDESYRCDTLINTDLVRPESGDYLFAHALIQEGVYSSLLHARKRELHGRAAQWYREQEPALHAEHLDRAQDPGAAHAYLIGAQDEAHRFRYDTALRLVERGWELAEDGQLRYAIAMVRGELLRELARTEDSIIAFERALQAAGDDEQRCRAWLGVVAGHRITGAIAPAMEGLDRAQPIAERLQLWSACSRIHGMRGNLYFAQGKVAACGAEHQLALEYAQRANDVECEALAWSGLGDHCYAEGRMSTGLGHFRRCVELCRQAGLIRVEIPNLCMIGHCLNWIGEGEAGLTEVRKAFELSSRIGLRQIEVMALESVGFILAVRGDFDGAEPWIEKGTVVAREASARRYLATNHLLLARCRHAQGRLAEARALVAEAIDLSKQTSTGFLGPALFAAMAGVAEGAAERRRCLEEGHAMLGADCVAPSRLMFYRDAIEASLEDGNWDDALRYADALEQSVASEPIAFAQLVAARGRAMVAFRRDGPRPDVIAELTSVRARLLRASFGGFVAGIDAALTHHPDRLA